MEGMEAGCCNYCAHRSLFTAGRNAALELEIGFFVVLFGTGSSPCSPGTQGVALKSEILTSLPLSARTKGVCHHAQIWDRILGIVFMFTFK